METELLLFACFFAGLAWIVSAEATVLIATAHFGLEPLLAALSCTLGQSIMVGFMHRYGGGATLKWHWLQSQIERTRRRYAHGLETHFLMLLCTAAFVGLPPLTAMAVLAASFRIRAHVLLGIAIPLRAGRFFALATVGDAIAEWWHAGWGL